MPSRTRSASAQPQRKAGGQAPPTLPRVKLAPDDERRLLEAVQHAADGESIALTPEETRAYCETGELPERVKRWAASRG
jgi:hypothetical protein